VRQLTTAFIVALLAAGTAAARPLADYVQEAGALSDTDLDSAVALAEQATTDYPDSADAWAYLGAFTGSQAGATQDYMEASRLATLSFRHLDRAVELDSGNVNARYFRGMMGVNVPEFMGRLETGVRDLEYVAGLAGEPGRVPPDRLVSAWALLGQGYEKQGEKAKARAAWEQVITLAPGTEAAGQAEQNLQLLADQPADTADEALPSDPSRLVALARERIAAGEDDRAADALRRAIELDSTNLEACRLLLDVLDRLAGEGYDERITGDTDRRVNLSFEYYRVLDHAVRLAPGDWELRLWRGAAGIYMPFFVGKLESGIADLEAVAGADVDADTKAEALYLLGVGYQRKGMDYWTRVATEFSGTDAAADALRSMKPAVTRLAEDGLERPAVIIDFVLAFRDQLAPQTAVWVEDASGGFVRTVYVSGFSGRAKSAQSNLPRWSKSSGYRGCDAVTGASIDLGRHLYVWDLTDVEGNRVKAGTYTVRVECSWWPSMKYERAELAVQVGKQEQQAAADTGEFIPYLGTKYLP